jgi:hypothetical protein
MKDEELSKLLEKYYQGESSEEEEFILKNFFRGNNIPAEYMAEKEIFSRYNLSEAVPEPSEDFEDRIIAEIERVEKSRNTSKFRRVVLYSLSTAAGLIIIAGSYLFLNSSREPKDTFSDPKIAYAETMKILIDVSSKLNRGNKALQPLGRINIMTNESLKYVKKSTMIIGKSLNSIGNLDKAAGKATIPDVLNKNK